jgi:hypothetical protein
VRLEGRKAVLQPFISILAQPLRSTHPTRYSISSILTPQITVTAYSIEPFASRHWTSSILTLRATRRLSHACSMRRRKCGSFFESDTKRRFERRSITATACWDPRAP